MSIVIYSKCEVVYVELMVLCYIPTQVANCYN